MYDALNSPASSSSSPPPLPINLKRPRTNEEEEDDDDIDFKPKNTNSKKTKTRTRPVDETERAARKAARMARNRDAAQASRDRRKFYMAELESKVKTLEAMVSENPQAPSVVPLLEKTKNLEEENSNLKLQLSKQSKETEDLKKKLEDMERTLSGLASSSSTTQPTTIPPSNPPSTIQHSTQPSYDFVTNLPSHPSTNPNPSFPYESSTPNLSPVSTDSAESSSPPEEFNFSLFPRNSTSNSILHHPLFLHHPSSSKSMVDTNGQSRLVAREVSLQRKLSSVRSRPSEVRSDLLHQRVVVRPHQQQPIQTQAQMMIGKKFSDIQPPPLPPPPPLITP